MRSLIALSLAVAVSAIGAGRASAATVLKGTVGPGYTITLTTASGALVHKLKAGTYTIRVWDRSGNHDFHLTGRGVDKATEIVFKGRASWTVKLKAGTYTYKCDPHEIIMKGTFRVT